MKSKYHKMLSDKSNAQCNSHCSFQGQFSKLNCFKIGNYSVLATFLQQKFRQNSNQIIHYYCSSSYLLGLIFCEVIFDVKF